MPTISALDPSIRYDDADQEAAAQRAQQRDQMMRAWMQNQQVNAQRGMQQEDMGARERMFNAELADRGAGRQYNGGLQMNMLEMGQKPQMAQLDFQKQAYNDARGDTAGTRDFSNLQAQYKTNELRRLIGGPPAAPIAPGVAGAPATAPDPRQMRDDRALKFSLLGAEAPVDPEEQAQMQAQALIRQIIASKAAGADPTDLPGILSAFKSGDPSKIPLQKRPFAEVANRPDVQPMVAQFLREADNMKGMVGSGDEVKTKADYLDTMMSGIINTAQKYGADPTSTREALIEQLRQRGFNREDLLVGAAGRMGFGVQREMLNRLGLE